MKANDPNILSLIQIKDPSGNIIPWEYNLFPDGQVQFKIKKCYLVQNNMLNFDVKASLCNPTILDLFNQLRYTIPNCSFYINYYYGARCDKYTTDEYVVCNVAQKQSSNNTKYLAPHCNKLLEDSMYEFYIPDCINLNDYHLIVCPDESAFKRYENLIKNHNCMICEKERDQDTGRIISHKIPNFSPNFRKVLVIDDLCDGGNTFISVADSMPSETEKHLFIFHGVFSNNALGKLTEKFDKIFVSNSLPNYKEQMARIPNFEDKVVVFDVWN